MIKDEFSKLKSKHARYWHRSQKKGHCARCCKRRKLVTKKLCKWCREYRNNWNRMNILKPKIAVPIWTVEH